MRMTPLIPRQTVPDLAFDTLDHGRWTIRERAPREFTMVVVYRGLHCPICRGYLSELHRLLPEFDSRGVEVIVVSSDDRQRAERARDEWKLQGMSIGYGLDLETARRWGLYVSSGIGKTSAGIEEPSLFVEPGLFLIRPDATLYFGTVQTMPFARPHFADIVKAVDYVKSRDYPARGEMIDIAGSE